MSSNDYVDLINVLYNKTKAGKIKWQQTTVAGVIQVSFPPYVVTLLGDRLKIDNADGTYIGEVNEEQLKAKGIEGRLAAIYELAHHQSIGAQSAIDQIIKQLNGLQ
jgi:hypothetical protein